MMLQPGVLALLVGATLVLAMLLHADWIGLKVIARWDFSSSSAAQLELERQTHLVSSLTGYALGFEVLSAVLFVYTTDDLSRLFSGAMCATGVLYANPVGWSVLLVKLLIVLACPLWIAVNSLDQRAGDFPIVRGKYMALLLLTPLVAADLGLQVAFFKGLDPQIITSCCGSLFAESHGGVASELASAPAVPMMWAFFTSIAVFLVLAGLNLVKSSRWLRLVLALLAVELLLVALASVVSFVSLYVYQLPSHHCPFDMLKGEYGFVGYPLYASLFTAVIFALLPGITSPLRRRTSLDALIEESERRWLVVSIVAVSLFLAISCWPMLFGAMRLVGV